MSDLIEVSYKEKRINFMNSWPDSELFIAEKEYEEKIQIVKDKMKTIFKPFQLKIDSDEVYNKCISFIIDSLEELERKPNNSFEFMFKAYDVFSFKVRQDNITNRNKWLCDNKWDPIINSNTNLKNAFKMLLAEIPLKSCQYLYAQICDETTKAYKRVITDVTGNLDNSHRKYILDSIRTKYGEYNYCNYADSIRKPSMLIKRFVLRQDCYLIGTDTINVTLNDKLHILISGYLYSLRNDTIHGSSISITKSSKTNMSTYANSFFAFILLYYLVLVLVLDWCDDSNVENKYEILADNMIKNIEIYKSIFDKNIDG